MLSPLLAALLTIAPPPPALCCRRRSITLPAASATTYRCRLATVCRRWGRVIRTRPQLLHAVDVDIRGGGDADGGWLGMPRLRSLAEWLVRGAGRHVHDLSLRLRGSLEQDAAEASALVAAALACCRCLQTLSLDCGWSLTVGPWLAPLGRTLRRLDITATDDYVTLAGSLGAWGRARIAARGCISRGPAPMPTRTPAPHAALACSQT